MAKGGKRKGAGRPKGSKNKMVKNDETKIVLKKIINYVSSLIDDDNTENNKQR